MLLETPGHYSKITCASRKGSYGFYKNIRPLMIENPIAERMNRLTVHGPDDLGAQKESLCMQCVRINSEQRQILERLRSFSSRSGDPDAKRLFAESFSLQREFFALVKELQRIDHRLDRSRRR